MSNPESSHHQIEIIFQNQDIVVVDKPPHMLSVPPRFRDDKRPVLGKILEKQLGKKIFPVHRLDEEVGGLIIYALNSKAQVIANNWFEKKLIQKTYHALVTSVDEKSFENLKINFEKLNNLTKGQVFEWKCKLMRGKRRAYEHVEGKSSLTLAKFCEELEINGQKIESWELNPVTGRSHQLRYEMFKHLRPICGDELYGSKIEWNEGIALKAYRLDLSKIKKDNRLDAPEIIEIKKLMLIL